jgi:hypothetical protein
MRAAHGLHSHLGRHRSSPSVRVEPQTSISRGAAVAIRSVAFPLLSGGALVLGYAAFSWLRSKRVPALSEPETLREAGHPEPRDAAPHADEMPNVEARATSVEARADSEVRADSGDDEDDDGPLSERSPNVPEVLELDLDFEDELPAAGEASLHDSVAPEDIGALFLARATDALSPFGDRFERDHFDLDQFSFESSLLSEATARAANGEDGLDPREELESAAESERRPAHGGARS